MKTKSGIIVKANICDHRNKVPSKRVLNFHIAGVEFFKQRLFCIRIADGIFYSKLSSFLVFDSILID